MIELRLAVIITQRCLELNKECLALSIFYLSRWDRKACVTQESANRYQGQTNQGS
jgi:hypothetical protein